MHYTAQTLVDTLNREEGEVFTVRKVRYYAQIGLLSEPELVNGKKKYNTKHLEELRAIRNLQKTGSTLEHIKNEIRGLDVDALSTVSENATYFSEKPILDKHVYDVDEQVTLLFSQEVHYALQDEIIQAVQTILSKHKGEL